MSTAHRARDRLDRPLRGAYPALPPPLDRCSEWWARRRPRVRLLIGVVALLAVAGALTSRVAVLEQRFAAPPVRVLVAEEFLPVGTAAPAVAMVRLPALAVPDGALEAVPDDAVVAVAVPKGAVVTRAHLDVQGPGAALPTDQRAVPVPVEEGWGLEAGGFADVWASGDIGEPAALLVEAAPVLAVHDGDLRPVAVVGVPAARVAEVATAGDGPGLLLTHAPAASRAVGRS